MQAERLTYTTVTVMGIVRFIEAAGLSPQVAAAPPSAQVDLRKRPENRSNTGLALVIVVRRAISATGSTTGVAGNLALRWLDPWP